MDDSPSGLDLRTLPDELKSKEDVRRWEAVYDKVLRKEMPPPESTPADDSLLEDTLASLKEPLTTASQDLQSSLGRVLARRLTKLELKYTLEDLLLLETDSSPLSNSDLVAEVPDESESEGFNNVGANQRLSSVHIKSYLNTANRALDRAIQLGPNPNLGQFRADFRKMAKFHDLPLDQGGGVTRPFMFSRGIVLFADVDYLTRFSEGIETPGVYRLSTKVAAFQSSERITARIAVKGIAGDTRIVKAVDLQPGESRFLEVEAFLHEGAKPYLTIDLSGSEAYSKLMAAGGAKYYDGPGLAITFQAIEGPLSSSWPPASTQYLLRDFNLLTNQATGKTEVTSADFANTAENAIRRLAPRFFRRSVYAEEIERFANLAVSTAAGEGNASVASEFRAPLRAMLTAPQFIFFEEHVGKLDGFAIANRLSYFLWKSMPDDELLSAAQSGELDRSNGILRQVDRMLDDSKAERFIGDFAGQWLRLYKVNATRPDLGLYPEFDEILAHSIPQETEKFLLHLFRENHGIANLIDSDFVFVNRRLAEHYGIGNVEGLGLRRVMLPSGSPRGGLLTQAAILKTTANGTTTSPVVRGNFVLSNILGIPPNSPPANVSAIEPDTRGTTTVREMLAAHRDDPTCNRCHRRIDPPGFALESFDPAGGYREFYRRTGERADFGEFSIPGPPQLGAKVDCSGIAENGERFADITQFKQIMLQDIDQVARHFIRQLVVYSTGGNIEFADREVIENILVDSRRSGYGAKDILRQVVLSRMFRHK